MVGLWLCDSFRPICFRVTRAGQIKPYLTSTTHWELVGSAEERHTQYISDVLRWSKIVAL